jgi:hypothetical protein
MIPVESAPGMPFPGFLDKVFNRNPREKVDTNCQTICEDIRRCEILTRAARARWKVLTPARSGAHRLFSFPQRSR